jgi:predicted nucleic acid-binding protein
VPSHSGDRTHRTAPDRARPPASITDHVGSLSGSHSRRLGGNDNSCCFAERLTSDPRYAFDRALVEGEFATCDIVRLELLHSARSPTEFAQIRDELAALPGCPIDKEQWNRALQLYELLSAQGGTSQRPVKHPDLLIAAAAEAADVPVLHYDED